jgi:adenylate kinase family enzyme
LYFQEESKTIKEHIDKGLLLPDELVLKFIVDELEKNRDKGFLLDGKMKTNDQSFDFICFSIKKVILEH